VNIRDDIVLGQHSHVGMARTENQDFFGYFEPDDDREFDLKGRLVVVCDGMGGHAGGEIASRLAVQTIIEEYKKDTTGNVEEALRKAIEGANAAIQREGNKEAKLQGMGSTCTALVHRRDMVYFGQVGDSRGYLIRNGKIKQMTKDHSLVQELVDQGLIEKSEMEAHPDKNVILRSLGVKPTVDVDVSYVPTSPNDIFLICSDGLSGPVSEQEMLSIVTACNGDLKTATERLVELANRYGGFDNITVQCVKVNRTDTATTDKTKAGTVTANFTPEQVQASIETAKAEAAARGKKPPPTRGAVETPAAESAKADKADKGAKAEKADPQRTVIERPIEGIDTPGSGRVKGVPAAPPAKSGGGGVLLVVGLFLGIVLGGGGGFVAATKLGKPKDGGGPVAVIASVVDKAAADLEAAKKEMVRLQAETLCKDAFDGATKACEAAQAKTDAAEKLAGLHEAMLLCARASNQARAKAAEELAAKAKESAQDAEKKAKKDTPAYKRGNDEFEQGMKAVSDSDFAAARGHFVAAAALFEAAQ
jgi:protein phosphatase